jgi:CheY-like chemotaxis protein
MDIPTINVLRATNGKEVITLFKANPDISLILMDIKMSELSGLDVTRQIRKFNKTVPIIAQTAYAYASDKEKAIEAGCDDYIVKPINKNKLIQLIQKHTQQMN